MSRSNATEAQRVEMRALRQQACLIAPDATDQHASQAVDMYPAMQYDGTLIKVGTRIQWDDPQKGRIVKRAAADLWDREESNPDNAPALWDDLDYVDGVRVIPDVFPVGLRFGPGELGWWHGSEHVQRGVYENILPASTPNTWTPEGYPAGWRFVRE